MERISARSVLADPDAVADWKRQLAAERIAQLAEEERLLSQLH